MMPGKGDTDLLLASFAERVQHSGRSVCGCVQPTNINPTAENAGGMIIRTLPAGDDILISQHLGPGSGGCRLDQGALEQAVASVERAYSAKCDLLLINKFGKHEAQGRGFRDLIGRAVHDRVPVLVGLNALNEQAFFDFADGLQERVQPDLDALLRWFDQTVEASIA